MPYSYCWWVRANYLHLELKKYSFLLCQVCSIPFNTWVGRQHASNLNLAGKLAGVVFQFRCIHTIHVNFWFCKALPDYSNMIDNNPTGFIWSYLGSTWTAFMLVTLIFGIRATKLTFITAAGLLPFSWLVILGVVFIYSYSRFGRITQNKWLYLVFGRFLFSLLSLCNETSLATGWINLKKI